jgi:hypothetical protein
MRKSLFHIVTCLFNFLFLLQKALPVKTGRYSITACYKTKNIFYSAPSVNARCTA